MYDDMQIPTPVINGPPAPLLPVIIGPPALLPPVINGLQTPLPPILNGPPAPLPPVINGPPAALPPVLNGPPAPRPPVFNGAPAPRPQAQLRRSNRLNNKPVGWILTPSAFYCPDPWYSRGMENACNQPISDLACKLKVLTDRSETRLLRLPDLSPPSVDHHRRPRGITLPPSLYRRSNPRRKTRLYSGGI
ncbi:Hypothetical predicted protein [Mytilus galloprovincialis]|uniref:Uncharacterized protein n=1 Tax=Mytilus galloprovincialis TaxID=29158 RepID=A0A8B6G507_MYTGA|nr:Hypothetical predicted protein [Mytilus galloprovincialis]